MIFTSLLGEFGLFGDNSLLLMSSSGTKRWIVVSKPAAIGIFPSRFRIGNFGNETGKIRGFNLPVKGILRLKVCEEKTIIWFSPI